MLMRAPAGMTSLHSGHEKEDEASGRTVPRQCAQSSWLPPQGMILGSRSPSSKGSRHTGQSRALMASSAVKPGLAPTQLAREACFALRRRFVFALCRWSSLRMLTSCKIQCGFRCWALGGDSKFTGRGAIRD